MELSEERLRNAQKRLLLARMALLCSHGFYGLLLMHLRMALSEEVETAATDGERVLFAPDFLDSLSDRELEFVLMHEVLHVVLRHCARQGERQQLRFNVACDIVVNSIILQENRGDPTSITLMRWGESMHLAPNGREGREYTAEQIYEMLPPVQEVPAPGADNGEKPMPGGGGAGMGRWDDHSQWKSEEDEITRDLWVKRFSDACEAIRVRDPEASRGLLPAFAQRLLKELRQPQTDWRAILNEFVQLEINDYSFSPPDRRFQESPFFLPDFNEWGESDRVSDILFMIDTSGSVSDAMMTAAFSEVKGAVDQFDGNLKGWLGFFDAAVIEPVPFEGVEELLRIRPAGGGGTDFEVIFHYVRKFMEDNLPACIIILTDGYAPFPQERMAMGIPVLWLMCTDVEPPWGRVTRITVS